MIDVKTLPVEERNAILARRAYFKEWRKKNPDKVKEHNTRYWNKKFEEQHNKLSAGKESK